MVFIHLYEPIEKNELKNGMFVYRLSFAFAYTLYGLPKDHKAVIPGRKEEGPTQRFVCGAAESSNGPLSDIVSDYLHAT